MNRQTYKLPEVTAIKKKLKACKSVSAEDAKQYANLIYCLLFNASDKNRKHGFIKFSSDYFACSDIAIEYISDFLKHNHHIEALILKVGMLTTSSLKKLGEAITYNTGLNKIILTGYIYVAGFSR